MTSAAGEGDSKGSPKIRVAIIGGGCAGMTAAWQLAKLPGYEVSVYEKSWRLGGKGASGRDEEGFIREHGLHVWLGFYENAFGMIRDCYREVALREWGPNGKDPSGRLAHARFEDAFSPEPHIGVAGLRDSSRAQQTVWSGHLPPAEGLPGDPLDQRSNPFTLKSYLLRCVQLLKTLMLSVIAEPGEEVPGNPRPDARSSLDEALDLNFSLEPNESPELLIRKVSSAARDGTLTIAAAVLQAVRIVEQVLSDLNHSPQVAGSALNLLKAIASQVRRQLSDVLKIDEELRWKTEIIDIVMVITFGLYRDQVLLNSKGLDALNDFDYRDWLRKHGASDRTLESRFITGIYDLVFAYKHGDRSQPRLAAGVALRGALRMFFTYRGAMFWRMRSGMGDAVFAPLYKVLARGSLDHPQSKLRLNPVKFHFLHEVSKVTFAASTDGLRVSRLELKTLAESERHRTANPGDSALDHFGCWPQTAQSLLQQPDLAGVELTGRQELEDGKDFDAVIFAAGLEDFASLIDPQTRRKLPKQWEAALGTKAQTVATKALQVWLPQDLQDLGWHRGPAIISALDASYDTWADMTHTLASERAWRNARLEQTIEQVAHERAVTEARSVAYFCGVHQDQAPSDTEDQAVAQLLEEMQALWPSKLATPSAVLKQHLQTNQVGSERYSLSLPGSIRNRISPLDPFMLNLSVAGDWTACGLDAGCIEAAVMSGMLAAHAITGAEPSLDSIVGYDHP